MPAKIGNRLVRTNRLPSVMDAIADLKSSSEKQFIVGNAVRTFNQSSSRMFGAANAKEEKSETQPEIQPETQPETQRDQRTGRI